MALRSAQIWLSQSKCVFENLAFENWLFRNGRLDEKDILLVWSDLPSVVIGRHQNPYLEANLPFLKRHSICLSRRYSGGGAVYHDACNLNMSFLTSRQRHRRKDNLRFISDSLRRYFGIRTELNERDDLLLTDDGGKVSGTAARIYRDRAYHHLTLLVDADRRIMGQALRATLTDVKTTATTSTRSAVSCLRNGCSTGLSLHHVTDSLVLAFSRKYQHSETFNVQPTKDFPEISASLAELRSCEWIFGKTPKFDVHLSDSLVQVVNGCLPGRTLSDSISALSCGDQKMPL